MCASWSRQPLQKSSKAKNTYLPSKEDGLGQLAFKNKMLPLLEVNWSDQKVGGLFPGPCSLSTYSWTKYWTMNCFWGLLHHHASVCPFTSQVILLWFGFLKKSFVSMSTVAEKSIYWKNFFHLQPTISSKVSEPKLPWEEQGEKINIEWLWSSIPQAVLH